MEATYSIPECNLAELESRIEKLNRKATKLGVQPIAVAKTLGVTKYRVNQLTVDGRINSQAWATKDVIDAKRAGVQHPTAFLAYAFTETGEAMTWWNVIVSGETPRINGWEFVATLEPLTTEDGETLNLVQTVPGSECPPEFRAAVGRCDHCRAARRRNQTFVVRHESDECKCVGRQCLKDFLGYNGDPHEFATWSESLASLGELCGSAEDGEWLEGCGRFRERSWDLVHFLTLTACRIRLFGWLSRTKARDDYRRDATADVVLEMLTPPSPFSRKEHDELCAKHTTEACDEDDAEAAIEWARSLPTGELESSDYLANVNLVSRVGTVQRKTAGIAASILVAFRKAQELEIKRQQEAARPKSHHVGEVGTRIKLLRVTCERVIMSENSFGVTGIHKLTDDAGNDLVWFASTGKVIDEGATVHVAATVKSHGDFKGRKQTVLTRVSVWTEEAAAAELAKIEKKAQRAAKKSAKETAAA